MAVLEGESLLNCTAALLTFGATMNIVQRPDSSAAVPTHRVFAAQAGIVFGILLGVLYRTSQHLMKLERLRPKTLRSQ
jgi:NhaP-type Na+/H+ or K+/H+ antiporter